MIVYAATNKINGKRYIGATKHTISARKARHWYDANGRNLCRVFGAALKKYGVDGFEWAVLKGCSSKEEMFREEIRLISELRPEYNITTGGQGIFGVPYTEERRAKLSRSLTGKKMTPERRVQNALLLDRLRAKCHRAVVCLTDGRFFSSCKDASDFYGVTHSNIRGVAERGQATTKGGLSFAFSDVPLSREECEVRIQNLMERKSAGIRRSHESRRKPVVCMTDGWNYDDARSAGDFYGLTAVGVRSLCLFGGTSRTGLRFQYIGQLPAQKKHSSPEERAVAKERQEMARQRGVLKNSKRVICLDGDIVYESISEAARALGCCVEAVSASIRRNGRVKGKRFRFVG